MSLETLYFPVALSLAFTRRGIKRFAAHSLHSFEIKRSDGMRCDLVAPGGEIAFGVYYDSFERLPEGYTWVKFKENYTLATAKRGSGHWFWLNNISVYFNADRVYAIKILPQDDGQTDSCNFKTKDKKTFPYVSRAYFSVVGESKPTLPRVLEAFPLPIPGVQREHDPGVWDVPIEYDSIPVTYEDHIFSRFKHATIKPVAALRLEFDEHKNPFYRCSYFGPAPE